MGGAAIMTSSLEHTTQVPFNRYVADYAINNKQLVEGIRRGLAARREGKVKPWAEIKERLGIG